MLKNKKSQPVSFDEWIESVRQEQKPSDGGVGATAIAKYLEQILSGYITEPVSSIDGSPVLMVDRCTYTNLDQIKRIMSFRNLPTYLYKAVINEDDSFSVEYGYAVKTKKRN